MKKENAITKYEIRVDQIIQEAEILEFINRTKYTALDHTNTGNKSQTRQKSENN